MPRRDAAKQIHAGTEAAGRQRNSVFDDHVVEELRQEDPLRNLSRPGHA